MNSVAEMAGAPFARRTLLKGAGALGAGAALAQAGLVEPVAAQGSGGSLQDILNISTTVEMFGITFLTLGLNNIRAGKFTQPVPAPVVAVLEAARAQEQFHLDFFESLGGRALTSTFTFPDPGKLLTDVPTYFGGLAAEEEREIANIVAAMKTFTDLGRADLVKTMFQYAAEEAEHRVLANYVAGARPANDRAFEPMLYNTSEDFLAALKQLGFIGGSGMAATYPGPGVINATNVIYRTPAGPLVSCAAGASTTSPAQTPASPAQVPAQMPNTGGGGGAAVPWGLLGVSGLGLAAAAALTQLRRHAPDEER